MTLFAFSPSAPGQYQQDNGKQYSRLYAREDTQKRFADHSQIFSLPSQIFKGEAYEPVSKRTGVLTGWIR
jgi:hypothetical protein